MTIAQKLKEKSLELRKARNPLAASITFALSEIEKVGKNSGNRETTEDEAIKVVQKLIVTVEENIKFASKEDHDRKFVSLNLEKSILQSVLPVMTSEEDVLNFIDSLDVTEAKNVKGFVMKAVKEKFGALVDMKLVGTLILSKFGV